MNIQDFLDTLKRVLLERHDNYAPPYKNFRRIAARLTITFESKLAPGARINIFEAAAAADDFKDGRRGHDFENMALFEKGLKDAPTLHEDNHIDAGGYNALILEMWGQVQRGEIDVYGNELKPVTDGFRPQVGSEAYMPFQNSNYPMINTSTSRKE